MPNIRNFSNFLKERKLETIYKRWNALKKRKKKATSLKAFGEQRPAFAFKTANGITFRDTKTLQIITTTTKATQLKQIGSSFQTQQKDTSTYQKIKLQLKEGKQGTFKPQWKRQDIGREVFQHTIQYQTKKPMQDKKGKIFLTIKFVKGKQEATVRGGSRRLHNLSTATGRQQAFNEAFAGAQGEIDFSWERFEILDIRYFYTLPKTEQRLLFT